ncbi:MULTISPECIES: cell division protein FtsQ/DivIB [Pseudooceanicola]|uniref:cell division protein FtsQ/DivIB n=1 Tax=Pseudooceanicola TaxID=1679449 RepID=UPI0028804FBC|nr:MULTISPECIES: cell division protein FtsQ/DivIB [Pseudooceanicola]
MTPLTASRRKARHDPAPSRWSWRMQRLMLSPAFRFFLRVLLPLLVVALIAGIWLASETRREALVQQVESWKQAFEDRPQFMVHDVQITGASDETAAKVRDIVGLEKPTSSFRLDLDALRAQIEALPPVASAALHKASGGVLDVVVTERVPVAVWRTRSGLSVIDDKGEVTGSVGLRTDRSDLPLIAGAGANKAVPEALDILHAAQPVAARVRGIERIGERRWDLVLDRNQRILLPETKPVQALERVLALNQAQDLLARDITVVDMRLPARPTIRVAPDAIEEWQRIRDFQNQTKK